MDHRHPVPVSHRSKHPVPHRSQHSPSHRSRDNSRDRRSKDGSGNRRSKGNSGSRRKWRNHFVATSAEFVGTFLFLYFAFAIHVMALDQAPNEALNQQGTSSLTIVIISMGYAFSLLVTAWTMYRISGGLFNPAITLGLCFTGAIPWMRGLLFLPAQLAASMAAAGLVSCMFPSGIERVNTSLSAGTSIVQGLFIEMFLTAQLTFTVLMLAVEKSKDTFIAPLVIGLALFVAELAGVFYTGGSLNPARSFGPAVVSKSFPGHHYIYWIGPLLGALLAVGYYRFVKYLDYEDANPDQDAEE